MSKMQRTKGATYEREICARLSEECGRKIQRNIGQARDGGTDIPFGNFLIECKRRKTLGTIEKWLKQAKDATACDTCEGTGNGAVHGVEGVCNQCDGEGCSDQIPVVVARSDAGKSLAILSLDHFLTLVRLAGA